MRAIVEDPFDDLPRLALADLYEEDGHSNSLRVASMARDMMALDAALKSLPPTDPHRERKAPPYSLCMPRTGCEVCRLRRRDIDSHTSTRKMLCTVFGEALNIDVRDRSFGTGLTLIDPFYVGFTRGMVGEIETVLNVFMKDHDKESSLAKRLFAWMPITRVILEDRQPFEDLLGFDGWLGWTSHESVWQPNACVPKAVFGFLPKLPGVRASANSGSKYYVWHKSRSTCLQLAKDALSLACVNYGRSLNGLPLLRWEQLHPDDSNRINQQ